MTSIKKDAATFHEIVTGKPPCFGMKAAASVPDVANLFFSNYFESIKK